MTSADQYGSSPGSPIQRDYVNYEGRLVSLSAETVAGLQDLLGAPDPDVAERSPLVVRPGALLDCGDGAPVVRLEDGTERRLDLSRPLDLPIGYHWLSTRSGERRLIVSPGVCFSPPGRAWGWTAQLYATRSRRSWGIGDFADLGRLTTLARDQGAGFVLVNPLHAGGATGSTSPQQASPYYPSSRRFFSPLYLAVEDVDGAREVLGGRLDGLVAAGRALNCDRGIDRGSVWQHKRAALWEVFDTTREHLPADFHAWRRGRGAALDEFAAWSVLQQRYDGDWRTWSQEARRPDGPVARGLVVQNGAEMVFVAWLQWQADRQLRRAGRNVPVLQDLPIGVDPGGADAWAFQDVHAMGVSVGAPPDLFNRAGQDWGLPPFVPWRLQAANYEPFIQAIRATIALAGGLRIDHVMGLFRLWWIPPGMNPEQGGFVRYPYSDLLDIVALESARAAAVVVGEDLGTVEAGVREELAARNILSYRLLWFETDPPPRWPAASLAAVSTHDLPTVAGIWDGSDLAEQRQYGVDADEQAAGRLRGVLTEQAGVAEDASTPEAVAGAYRLLAQAPSTFLAASLDDALAEPHRPNMPGTPDRDNWSQAHATTIEELSDHRGVTEIAAAFGHALTSAGNNK